MKQSDLERAQELEAEIEYAHRRKYSLTEIVIRDLSNKYTNTTIVKCRFGYKDIMSGKLVDHILDIEKEQDKIIRESLAELVSLGVELEESK